jgi:hypothetical protein
MVVVTVVAVSAQWPQCHLSGFSYNLTLAVAQAMWSTLQDCFLAFPSILWASLYSSAISSPNLSGSDLVSVIYSPESHVVALYPSENPLLSLRFFCLLLNTSIQMLGVIYLWATDSSVFHYPFFPHPAPSSLHSLLCAFWGFIIFIASGQRPARNCCFW